MLFFRRGWEVCIEQVAGSSLYECVSLLTAWGFFFGLVALFGSAYWPCLYPALESVRRAAVRDADDLGRRAEWEVPRTMQ